MWWEISVLIYNFTCEIIRLPWQPSVHLYVSVPRWQQSFLKNVTNEDVKALKDALENLNTQMSTSRSILSGIFSKNSENYELKPKFKLYKVFSMWSSRLIINLIKMSKTNDFKCNSSPIILVWVTAWLVVIFGINTTSDISKFLYVHVIASEILKCHEWYFCQRSRTNHVIICLYYYPQEFCNFHM